MPEVKYKFKIGQEVECTLTKKRKIRGKIKVIKVYIHKESTTVVYKIDTDPMHYFNEKDMKGVKNA